MGPCSHIDSHKSGFAKRQDSQRHSARQNVSARNEAGPLECLAAGDILRIAACCRDAPALVTDALQFLNQVGPDAALSKRLAYFHVDVALGPIVMDVNHRTRQPHFERDPAADYDFTLHLFDRLEVVTVSSQQHPPALGVQRDLVAGEVIGADPGLVNANDEAGIASRAIRELDFDADCTVPESGMIAGSMGFIRIAGCKRHLGFLEHLLQFGFGKIPTSGKDGGNLLRVLDVVQRIGVEQDKIGDLAFFYRAQVFF